MSDFVIPCPPTASIPVSGGGAFPVRRVYCVGRNYADHAIEMGGDPNRESPFFFQKNADNIDASGVFPYPTKSNDVHHEIELLVALKSGGSNIPVETALDHVWGYCVCLDMTRRDLQGQAKKAGRPWEIAKAFDHSAPVGPLFPVAQFGHPGDARMELKVNGNVRQQSNLGQMIWKVAEIIACLSEYFELAPGDIILTGTPAGVGPVQRGDRIEAAIEGLGGLSVTVV